MTDTPIVASSFSETLDQIVLRRLFFGLNAIESGNSQKPEKGANVKTGTVIKHVGKAKAQ